MSPAKKKTTKKPAAKATSKTKKPSQNQKNKRFSAAKTGKAGKKRTTGPKKKTGGASRKKGLLREAVAVSAVEDNPSALELAHRIAKLALDKKAEDVVILDVRGKTSYADYLVLASGESERQVAAMAEHVEVSLKAEGKTTVGSEGYDTGQWVLIDFGDVVAHLFFREVRDFYDLDGLWADAAREKVA